MRAMGAPEHQELQVSAAHRSFSMPLPTSVPPLSLLPHKDGCVLRDRGCSRSGKFISGIPEGSLKRI